MFFCEVNEVTVIRCGVNAPFFVSFSCKYNFNPFRSFFALCVMPAAPAGLKGGNGAGAYLFAILYGFGNFGKK
jgi:hypothetical protein